MNTEIILILFMIPVHSIGVLIPILGFNFNFECFCFILFISFDFILFRFLPSFFRFDFLFHYHFCLFFSSDILQLYVRCSAFQFYLSHSCSISHLFYISMFSFGSISLISLCHLSSLSLSHKAVFKHYISVCNTIIQYCLEFIHTQNLLISRQKQFRSSPSACCHQVSALNTVCDFCE